ncbi:MAG: integrase arm-type DNA-binding domain-containing protein [Desulfovibrionaceae bacterium]|nr:integrase arm-type DNA-binding domain-containing protein [Desulfovibrionaceae bacterium]
MAKWQQSFYGNKRDNAMATKLSGKLTENKVATEQCDAGKTCKKLADGNGLYLVIMANGGRYWHFQYRHDGKQKKLALGTTSVLSLQDARASALEAKQLLARGVDPSANKRETKAKTATEAKSKLVFRVVYEEWFQKRYAEASEKTKRNITNLAKHILSQIGDLPIVSVTFSDLKAIINDLENRSLYTTARAAVGVIQGVFRFARINFYIKEDPAEFLSEILQRKGKRVNHFPAITTLYGISRMLNRIDEIPIISKNCFIFGALKLLPMLATRPSELLSIAWEQVDLETGVINVYESQTKTAKARKIFLSHQAIEVFRMLQGRKLNDFVFFANGNIGHLIKDNLVRRLYDFQIAAQGEMCLHGWRSVLQSTCVDLAVPYELHQTALSHQIGGDVFNAYNRTSLESRMKYFWQWWSDTLDCIKFGLEPAKWTE